LGLAAAACGDAGEEVPGAETREPTASATSAPVPALTLGPGTTVWRWVNVTLAIPNDSELGFGPTNLGPGDLPPAGGPAVELSNGNSNLWIDAESGIVFIENVRDADRAVFDEVLRTLDVSTLGTASAAWPFSPSITEGEIRERTGTFSFVRPLPSTGLYVGGWISDGGEGGEALSLTNGRSHAYLVVTNEGTIKSYTEAVLPEDRLAFDRWIAEVVVCKDGQSC
jgi:hypothetical protein